jgi:hypothetical protein
MATFFKHQFPSTDSLGLSDNGVALWMMLLPSWRSERKMTAAAQTHEQTQMTAVEEILTEQNERGTPGQRFTKQVHDAALWNSPESPSIPISVVYGDSSTRGSSDLLSIFSNNSYISSTSTATFQNIVQFPRSPPISVLENSPVPTIREL